MSAVPLRKEQPSPPGPKRTTERHLRAVPPLADASPQIPDPNPGFVCALARQIYEVVEGTRNAAQLGANATVAAIRQLMVQRALLHERRCAYRDHRSSVVQETGGVHICRVQPRIAEATVVVHTERRAHAVALRLEWSHGRWRACEAVVL